MDIWKWFSYFHLQDEWFHGEDVCFEPLNVHEKTLRNVKLLVNYASQVFTTFSWQLHLAYVYPHTSEGIGGHLLRRMH